MFQKIILIGLFLVMFAQAKIINVAASANVSYAIGSIVKEFEKTHSNIKVQIILASSGKLTAQIKNGAPYQLFLSANMKYPNALYRDNLAITKPKIYAKGSLALLSSTPQDFNNNIIITTNKKIQTIAVANPKTAPYGKAAIEALKKANLYKRVKNKLIFTETVSQAVAYTLKATDMGFVAKSLLFSPKMAKYKKGINWIEVNPNLYTPINQGIVILKNGSKNKDVQEFYNFILSKKAKKIFKKYGYQIDG